MLHKNDRIWQKWYVQRALISGRV